MSQIIQFLVAAGREPALSPSGYATAVAALEIPDAQRQALLERDPAALNALLGGRARMICMINAPDEEEHETNPDDGDGDGVPDDDQQPLQN